TGARTAGSWSRSFPARTPSSWWPTSSVRRSSEMSGTVEARLAERGLTLPPVAAPVAAYVPAIRTGRYISSSGQVPLVDGKLATTGKVGAEVTPEQAKELAATC